MLQICAPKRIVATIHGIRTDGDWQKEVSTSLALHGLVPINIHYGYFGLIKFLIPKWRENKINAVREELRDIFIETGRPLNIVAHSFGTYIALEALEREQGELIYDRVILTGSIIRSDFPWGKLFSAGWVRAVRNERADGDTAVTLASIASRGWLRFLTQLNAGDSGKHAFAESHRQLVDKYITGEHSSSHNRLKYDRWAKFLSYPCLSEKLLNKTKKELQLLQQWLARILEIPEDHVRTNLFSIFDDVLHMVPGACVNMNYAPEYEVTIEPGHGGTGKAFLDKNPLIVVNNSGHWTHDLPREELKKVEPRLKWILSLPIYNAETKMVYGVVNVDGLDEIPTLLTEQPEAVLLAMQLAMEDKVASLMALAFEGSEYAL